MSSEIPGNHGKSYSITSGDQYEVAMQLTDQLFDVLGATQADTVDLLKKVRTVLWHNMPARTLAEEKTRAQEQGRVVSEVLGSLDTPDKRTEFMDAFARMGHLYEMAGLVARDNMFETLRRKGEGVPGGTKRFIEAQVKKAGGPVSVDQLINQLNAPQFEIVMTTHPTNVNSASVIHAMRDLGNTVDAVRLGRDHHQSIHESIEDFCKAPLIHQRSVRDAQGQHLIEGKPTVYDETQLVLSYLRNIYDDLPHVFGRMTDSLDEHARLNMQRYDPLSLNPKLRFAAWGSSGDKDGNPNVNSDTTLRAIALHKKEIITAYKDSLQEIPQLEEFPQLKKWQGKLGDAQAHLNKSLTQLYRAHRDEIRLSNDEFDRLSKDVSDVFNDMASAKKEFVRDLTEAYKSSLSESFKERVGNTREANMVSDGLLNLTRRARVFGFGFGRIEYRETAEEYARVVGEVIPEYGEILKEETKIKKAAQIALDEFKRPEMKIAGYEQRIAEIEKERDGKLKPLEEKKVSILDATLSTPGKAEELLQAALPRITREGQGKPYTKITDADATPIAYNTIKRMELARDHPGMITDNVLAECEQTSNLLEAQFLQQAVTKQGKRPVLGVVPLFENPRSLADADKTLERAYANKSYQNHLRLVAHARAEENGTQPEITQQVQIAHSDNTRRSGLPAARSFIDEAHDKIRAVNARTHIAFKEGDAEALPVKSQFFEGGSASDALRGGVRSVTAACNQYGLNDFAKFTYQGGDLLNYFNYPASVGRLIPRVISNLAANSSSNGVLIDGKASKPKYFNEMANDVARRALQGTLHDYENNVFNKDNIGILLAQLGSGNTREASAAGAGSSRGERTQSLQKTHGASADLAGKAERMAFAAGSTVTMGASHKVDPQSIRTITFSELLQHGGVVPTWIGSKELAASLQREVKDELDHYADDAEHPLRPQAYVHHKKQFFSQFRDYKDGDKPLTPEKLNYFYQSSAVFKDVVDRMAFGIAMTDMNMVERLHPELRDKTTGNPEFMDRLQNEYKEAAKLCHAALTGKSPIISADADSEKQNDELRFAISAKLPHIHALVQDKSAYRGLLLEAKSRWKNGEVDGHLDKLIHSALDDVMHGRFIPADDTEYAKFLQHTNPRKYGQATNGISASRA